MVKVFLSLFVVAMTVSLAQAHALYIIVQGEKVQVIFSDDLKPDARIKAETWKKVGTPTITCLNGGKPVTVNTKMGEAALTVETMSKFELLSGTTDYGISKHGDKPKHLTFLYKHAQGISGDATDLGKKCELDIIPVVADGKIKFQVKAKGEVRSKTELSIIVPGKTEKVNAVTDEKGFTQEFDTKGMYGVTARKNEAKSGDYKGEKYEEVGFVATLVTELK